MAALERFAVIRRWLDQRFPAVHQLTLSHRHIFILPTGYGYLYLVICLLMFIGGINYQNNLILALTFLLVSLFLIAILHTFRNLLGLTVRGGAAVSGFAGEQGALQLLLSGRDEHHSLVLHSARQPSSAQQVTVLNDEDAVAWINVPLSRRGRIPAPRIRIESVFPLGLLKAWSYVLLDKHCLSWPKPLASAECPGEGGNDSHVIAEQGHQGNEEFDGVRSYQPGDSLRRIDWKGYARGGGLNTKQFEDPASGRLWLHWDRLEGMATEQRLSVLCYWVMHLDQQHCNYGLALPGFLLQPDRGDAHRKQALDALASYPEFC